MIRVHDPLFNKIFPHLPFFLEVAYSGSELKASRVLSISQSTISYHLNVIEKELGISLFVKGSNGLVLTEEGVSLYNITKQFHNNATTLLNKWRKTATIKIGVTPPIYPIIANFLRSNKLLENKLSLSLETHTSGENIHLLSKDALDICFTGSTDFGELDAIKHVTTLPVINDELVAISGKKYNVFNDRRFINIERLKDYPCVVRDLNSATYVATLRMLKNFCISPNDLKVVYIGKNFYDVVNFLDTYPAYSVVSKLQMDIHKNLKNIDIIKLTPKKLAARSIFAIYKNEDISGLLRNFVLAIKNKNYHER